MSEAEVVIVGGGIAGLTAAWNLRDRDVVVLEAEDRVGGRVRSDRHGDYWLSFGAHMFPRSSSVVGRLLSELGLTTTPIHGTLINIASGGEIVSGGRAELYPLRLPLSLPARVSFTRVGLKLRWAAAQYERLSEPRAGETARDVRARLLAFMDDRSFADFIGPLHPEVEPIFRAAAARLTCEIDEVQAGVAVALFASAFSVAGTEHFVSLDGGPSQFPETLARYLGGRVHLSAEVREISYRSGVGVRVRYDARNAGGEITARCAIVTAPAPVARELIRELPTDTAYALDGITYGPFVIGAISTSETSPMPWDEMYSLVVADKSFGMLFNHGGTTRRAGEPRAAGGALMVYGGADRARALMDRTDAEISQRFADDLYSLFPDARGVVERIAIRRLPTAIAYSSPGRAKLQAALERGVGDVVFLAGDYVGFFTTMESAATTGVEAAVKARGLLAA